MATISRWLGLVALVGCGSQAAIDSASRDGGVRAPVEETSTPRSRADGGNPIEDGGEESDADAPLDAGQDDAPVDPGPLLGRACVNDNGCVGFDDPGICWSGGAMDHRCTFTCYRRTPTYGIDPSKRDRCEALGGVCIPWDSQTGFHICRVP
jgi:hypothetical protein